MSFNAEERTIVSMKDNNSGIFLSRGLQVILKSNLIALTGVSIAAAMAMAGCKSPSVNTSDSTVLSVDDQAPSAANLKIYQIMDAKDQLGANLRDPSTNSASAGIIAIGSVAEAGGWPDAPRKSAFHDISFKNETTLYFGVSTNILSIVDIASSLNLSMGMQVNKQLLLAKHTPNNEDLTYLAQDGTVQLKLDDQLKFGASCTYEASAVETMLWANSIKVMGNGVGNGTTLSQATKVSLVSEFFPVKPGNTVASLMNICHDVYASRVQKALKGELQRQIIAKTQYEGSNSTTEKLAIRSALWGPRSNRVKLNNHHWNFKVADVTASGDGHVLVKGRIDHSVNVQLDDYIDYTCEANNLEEKQKDIKFKQRSAIRGWNEDAKKIVDLICKDAYVQFRNTKYSRIGGNEAED